MLGKCSALLINPCCFLYLVSADLSLPPVNTYLFSKDRRNCLHCSFFCPLETPKPTNRCKFSVHLHYFSSEVSIKQQMSCRWSVPADSSSARGADNDISSGSLSPDSFPPKHLFQHNKRPSKSQRCHPRLGFPVCAYKQGLFSALFRAVSPAHNPQGTQWPFSVISADAFPICLKTLKYSSRESKTPSRRVQRLLSRETGHLPFPLAAPSNN